MIPIALERNFKPDGWLGMLAGSKVWLDFTEESKFEGHMQMLLRQIGEKGKSERGANIAYVNGQANKGRLNSFSLFKSVFVNQLIKKKCGCFNFLGSGKMCNCYDYC